MVYPIPSMKHLCVAVLPALAIVAVAPPATALERQWQFDGRMGLSTATGTHGALGLALDLQARYGLNDAFSLYANASYTVGFPEGAPRVPRSPRHGTGLSLGVVYAFDYLRIVPYVGVGARADVFVAPDQTWWSPALEGRLGLSWLLRRTLALDLQAAYVYPFLANDRLGNLVTVTAGVSWHFDP